MADLPGAVARYEGTRTPAVDRLAGVARALDDTLRKKVVFVGGSILPFLETDRLVFGSVRPTKDVDGVVLTRSYSEKAGIEDELRRLNFRHDVAATGHADRWRTPDGTIFDLVSCGAHTGGTGNEHDRFAVETAASLDLPPVILHATAVGFLVIKCAAFRDRGMRAPLQSRDLMDVVHLAATRPELSRELLAAPATVQAFVRREVAGLLSDPIIASAIPTHIADRDPLADDVEENVMQVLRALAGDRA